MKEIEQIVDQEFDTSSNTSIERLNTLKDCEEIWGRDAGSLIPWGLPNKLKDNYIREILLPPTKENVNYV